MATATKHSPTCRMAFGRKDPDCPRCQELLQGAAPRPAHFRSRAVEAVSIIERFCFCGAGTPLWVSRCPRCGKPPYTD